MVRSLRSFYRYYLLHQKYKRNFNIDQIMSGHFEQDIIPFKAVFDEKLGDYRSLIKYLEYRKQTSLSNKKEQLKLLMRLQSKNSTTKTILVKLPKKSNILIIKSKKESQILIY